MIPDSIQQLAGKSFGKTVFRIEQESVRRFADAVGDTNPLFNDSDYAVSSRYGSIIAPPGFISSPWYWGDSNCGDISGLGDIIQALIDAGYLQTFDSGIEYEFFEPVKAGDTITAESCIRDIVERGKGEEKAVFLFIEITYTNQDNTTVAVSKVTTTHR